MVLWPTGKADFRHKFPAGAPAPSFEPFLSAPVGARIGPEEHDVVADKRRAGGKTPGRDGVEPLRRPRLSEGVIAALKKMIANDGFAPGDRFYSENELTAKFGVSRSSVREAVRILEVTGQLTVKHGKGIFIIDTYSRPYDAFVDWLRNNDQFLQEHFEVRLIIEPQTARLAALGATPEDVDALAEAHARFVRNARLGLMAETIRCDREFHKLLGKATHNNVLFALTRSLTTSMFDDWVSSLHVPGRAEKTVVEHGLVLAAVKARDAEAAMERMATHLRNAVREIRESSGR